MTSSIFVAGDVVNYHQKDGRVIDYELEKVIYGADYSVCNFEAPVSGYGSPIPKSGPHHSQLPETVDGLKEQGFDLLLLANNHIMDFGYEALKATIDRAELVSIETVGAGHDFTSAYKPVVKDVNGLKVGMINACEAQFGVIDYFRSRNEPGYAWINHHEIDQAVMRLKEACDYVIVFSHAGLERYSVPQKEWRVRYKMLCDAGADVVIGSHPHVPQGYESYKKSFIFYSLGNFYFDSKNYLSSSDSTYSVMLNLSHKEPKVDFDLIYICKDGGKTRLATDNEEIDVRELNGMLEDGVYEAANDEMNIKAYRKIIRDLEFSFSKGLGSNHFKKNLKNFFKRHFLRNRRYVDKDVLQLHLLRNEAYYYAARHALEIKYREKCKNE